MRRAWLLFLITSLLPAQVITGGGGGTSNPVSFLGSRFVGGCPLFPDNSYWYVSAANAPTDYGQATYSAAMTPTGNPVGTATWAAGVASVTFPGAHGLTNGGFYFVNGATPAGYNSTSSNGTDGSGHPGAYFQVTVTGANTLTYPLVADPGGAGSNLVFWKNFYLTKMIPGMAVVNLATNATPTPAINSSAYWVSDSGAFPLTGTMQAEGPNYGNCPVSSTGCGASDNHVLVINTDTCMLWEGFALNSGAPPYGFGSIAAFNLRSNNIRSNTISMWYGMDTTGLTSADAAGLPIWPGVMTHSEMYGTLGILHTIRATIPQALANKIFVHPATHTGANTQDFTRLPMGARLVLRPDFDTTTCHMFDKVGLNYSTYPAAARLLTYLQTTGIIVSDIGGSFIGLVGDADPLWGNGLFGSDNWDFNGWTHCIVGSDWIVKRVYPTQGINSMAVK